MINSLGQQCKRDHRNRSRIFNFRPGITDQETSSVCKIHIAMSSLSLFLSTYPVWLYWLNFFRTSGY